MICRVIDFTIHNRRFSFLFRFIPSFYPQIAETIRSFCGETIQENWKICQSCLSTENKTLRVFKQPSTELGHILQIATETTHGLNN